MSYILAHRFPGALQADKERRYEILRGSGEGGEGEERSEVQDDASEAAYREQGEAAAQQVSMHQAPAARDVWRLHVSG